MCYKVDAIHLPAVSWDQHILVWNVAKYRNYISAEKVAFASLVGSTSRVLWNTKDWVYWSMQFTGRGICAIQLPEFLGQMKHLSKVCSVPHRPLRKVWSLSVKCLCPCQPVKLNGQIWFTFSWTKHSCSEADLLFCLLIFVKICWK